MRGRLMGNPFTGYCVGNRGICVLLFHRNYRPSSVLEDITFATLQNNSRINNLSLIVLAMYYKKTLMIRILINLWSYEKNFYLYLTHCHNCFIR